MTVIPLPRLFRTAPRPVRPQRSAHTPRLAGHLRDVALTVENTVGLWIDRYTQRQQLQTLPDEALADLGLSRCDVEGEVRKAFWRP